MKKVFIFISFIAVCYFGLNSKLIYPYTFAPSRGFVNDVEKNSRDELCLNGYWQFQPIMTPEDYKHGLGKAPELPQPTKEGWDKVPIKIPSPWNINNFANRNTEGPDHRNFPSYPKEWEDVLMGWLKKSVKIPVNWSGEEIILYFEAVAGQTEIFVNGHKVGENFDLFLPFSFDITKYVTPGEEAEILVGVRSQKLFEDNSTVGRRIVPAGSMWGYFINGIWQDVYLLALPKIRIDNVFIKPWVNQNSLELDVTLTNNTPAKETITLGGEIKEWINKAGTDINSAPEPKGKLGQIALSISPVKMSIPADSSIITTIRIPVNGKLEFWTPEHPNLYSLVLDINKKKNVIDTKYQRFGWRQWTFKGTQLYLNGAPYTLHGDAWHFQGIPQMTRRYAYAWYKAIKDMNGNAVRPHAQVYPQFYLDLADEMGICVLDETANWASDGGPKLDSEIFWENSKDHLSRFVLRDRNHPSVFGWSISNENKPVILNVYNRPDLMPQQEKAWKDWRDIVMNLDPTRQWISSDGEEDGSGILPVTVGHYGDSNSMKSWREIGKPWGVGEHGMAYYGTPEQVSVYNGDRAYESIEGRMEGLANESYNLIAEQRKMGASYTTVFNAAWYALQPLPLGKEDISIPPNLEEGVFFSEYIEGQPGVQPERIGPYSSTFNPGYDPNLPLYKEWPMFSAIRAANAPEQPAWSEWAVIEKKEIVSTAESLPLYNNIYFIGPDNSLVKENLLEQGVEFSDNKTGNRGKSIYFIDATLDPSQNILSSLEKALEEESDIWIWAWNPDTEKDWMNLLPADLSSVEMKRASFIPSGTGLTYGLNNSDFYFCQLQNSDIVNHTLKGKLVNEGLVLLDACKTDWRNWNMRPEELKTVSVLRSEREAPDETAVLVKYTFGNNIFYVTTLSGFEDSERSYNTLNRMLQNAGLKVKYRMVNPDDLFNIKDGHLNFPKSSQHHLMEKENKYNFDFYIFSPRALDDLLIEPDMPKLMLKVFSSNAQLKINEKDISPIFFDNKETVFNELPLLNGWNHINISLPIDDKNRFDGYFNCDNNAAFIHSLKASYSYPKIK